MTSTSTPPQTTAAEARSPRTGPLIAIGVYLGAPTALCAVRVARRPQYVSDILTAGEAFRPGISVWRTEEFDLPALGLPQHSLIPQVAKLALTGDLYAKKAAVVTAALALPGATLVGAHLKLEREAMADAVAIALAGARRAERDARKRRVGDEVPV